eukprot:TRINITY_DN15177_c0_g1_i1.p1 TRINITY_DN15177_c0_g1~~TRINITY_DN15177_c0_g1_i1.p1  ORF type:complete len:248 (+),score=41.34 TRINITY_DN15177_c0_g1_i1:97-744(+)
MGSCGSRQAKQRPPVAPAAAQAASQEAPRAEEAPQVTVRILHRRVARRNSAQGAARRGESEGSVNSPLQVLSEQLLFDGQVDRSLLLHFHLLAILESLRDSDSPVGATAEEIGALPTVSVSRQEIARGGGSVQCAVCYDAIPPGELATQLPCEHMFCPECIRQWLQINGSCPICRAPIGSGNGGESGAVRGPGAGLLPWGSPRIPGLAYEADPAL